MSDTNRQSLPEQISLEEALRAAFYMTQQYIQLERKPDAGLVLFLEYLRSDPACWSDWQMAVHAALADRGSASSMS